MHVGAGHFIGGTVMEEELAKAHVLAGLGDEVLEVLAKQGVQGGGIGRLLFQHGCGNLGCKILEIVAAGHKVCLALHGTKGNVLFVSGSSQGHKAFAGGAAGLLGSLGHALLTQKVDGLFHVAVNFGEGFLAIHHACAGSFAQFFYHCGCNRHCGLLTLWY